MRRSARHEQGAGGILPEAEGKQGTIGQFIQHASMGEFVRSARQPLFLVAE
jgi:hypothetical protein